MFEKQQELEKAQGYRGPATRFFGSIDSPAEAALVLREMCASILFLAALVGLSAIRVGPVALIAAAVIAIPAALLFVLRRRGAAVALFVSVAAVATGLLVLGSIRGIWQLLFWVAALQIAGRASRAAFKLHALARAQA